MTATEAISAMDNRSKVRSEIGDLGVITSHHGSGCDTFNVLWDGNSHSQPCHCSEIKRA